MIVVVDFCTDSSIVMNGFTAEFTIISGVKTIFVVFINCFQMKQQLPRPHQHTFHVELLAIGGMFYIWNSYINSHFRYIAGSSAQFDALGGLKDLQKTQRIVNGKEAGKHSWPWMVRIQKHNI
jgi:hypothetical protein